MVDLLRVGTIASTHGIRGEVKVYPTTDDIHRFKDLKHCILDTGREQLPLEVEGVKFFKQFAILKFKGYDSINDIEKYRGKDILVTRENAVALEENETFIADLIGLDVVTDEGGHFGVVTDIMQTAANDVYVIQGDDGKEYLFPAIRQCILDVDLKKSQVTVHIMKGLLDL